jgi:hypothetical protein
MTAPTGQPTGVINPVRVAAKERALLEALRRSPGLRTPEICRMVDEPPASTVGRLRRLEDRGEIERTATHKWFIAGTAPDVSALDLSLDDERMLSAMRVILGGSSAEIAALIGCNGSAVIARARKLARLGLTVKGPGGHWRAADQRERQPDDEVSEFETPERSTPLLVFDRGAWIWPIAYYVELLHSSSMFACRRYG